MFQCVSALAPRASVHVCKCTCMRVSVCMVVGHMSVVGLGPSGVQSSGACVLKCGCPLLLRGLADSRFALVNYISAISRQLSSSKEAWEIPWL